MLSALLWPWILLLGREDNPSGRKDSPSGRVLNALGRLAVLSTFLFGGWLYVSAVDDGGGGVQANLWVDTNGGSCTRQAPAASYSDAAACATFDAAYQVALGGDTIRVRAGTYPFQQINVSSPNKTLAVTITPETDAAVVDVAGVRINGADWVTLRGLVNTQNQSPFLIDDDGAGNSPDNNTLENIDGPWFDIRDANASNNSILGGDWGPCSANAGGDGQGCTARLLGINEIVDGATIHNITSTDATNFHPDGIFVRGCVACVIRNSTFYNNQITNLRIQNCCSNPDNSDIEIYNNWFGFPWSTNGLTGLRHDAIDLDNAVPGLVIAFNSFASACVSSTCAAYVSLTTGTAYGTAASPAKIYGNLIGRTNSSCGTNATWSYNVFKKFSSSNGISCDATEVGIDPGLFPYVSDPSAPGIMDYTITGAAWAGDELVPAVLCEQFPTDRNGGSRAGDESCDAGAVER